MAVYQEADRRRCEREAKKLFNDYCVYFNIVPNDFVGVNLSDFVGLEDFFKINLIAYELEERVDKLVQRSWELYFESIKFIKTHPQYLKNLKKSVFLSL